ncbi:hypothetical protein [Pseudomonas sp. PA15(2017)]|uniref:hypothetical protein n=1 Tax=Pseudomonas sp. PA15(2017) TaxID=1932111 RepID=UPI001439204D|nr:hypothetical protein [Pseudomonas sp. PA15(2017)]
MTAAEAQALQQLLLVGFRVEQMGKRVIRVQRGNDYRLVRQDGGLKRALGARR